MNFSFQKFIRIESTWGDRKSLEWRFCATCFVGTENIEEENREEKKPEKG